MGDVQCGSARAHSRWDGGDLAVPEGQVSARIFRPGQQGDVNAEGR